MAFDPDSYLSGDIQQPIDPIPEQEVDVSLPEHEASEGIWNKAEEYANSILNSDSSEATKRGVQASLDSIGLALSLNVDDVSQSDRIEMLNDQLKKQAGLRELYPRGWSAFIDKDFWTETIANQAVPYGGGLAAGVATGPAGPIAGPTAGIGLFGLQGYGASYLDAYADGITQGLSPEEAEEKARNIAIVGGGTEAISGLIPFVGKTGKRILDRVFKGSSKGRISKAYNALTKTGTRRLATGAAAEGLQEVAAETAVDIAKRSEGLEADFDPDRYLQSFVAGAGVGATFGGGQEALSTLSDAVSRQPEADVQPQEQVDIQEQPIVEDVEVSDEPADVVVTSSVDLNDEQMSWLNENLEGKVQVVPEGTEVPSKEGQQQIAVYEQDGQLWAEDVGVTPESEIEVQPAPEVVEPEAVTEEVPVQQVEPEIQEKPIETPSVEPVTADVQPQEEVEEISPEIESVTAESAKEALPTGLKKSRLSERIAEGKTQGQPLSEEITKSDKVLNKIYSVESNRDTVKRSIDYIDKSGTEKAFDDFVSDTTGQSDLDRNAIGISLLEHYNANNEYEKAITVAEKLSEYGTQGGQSIQILSALGNALDTQEGAISYVAKQFSKVGKGVKSQPDVKIAIDVLNKAITKPKKVTTREIKEISPNVSDAVDRILSRISKAAVGDESDSGVFSKEMFDDLSLVGSELIKMGFNKFSDWSKEMVKLFGKDVEPALKKAWSTSSKSVSGKSRKSIRNQIQSEVKKAGHKVSPKTGKAIENLLGKMERGEEISRQQVSNAFDQMYETPYLTKTKINKYKKHADRISRTAPGSFARRDATIDMFKSIDKDIQGVDTVDKLWSLWYGNILSGYSTHIRNMGDTALQVIADSTLLGMSVNPVKTLENLRLMLFGGVRGLKSGAYEGGRHLLTGDSIVGRDSESKFGPRSELEKEGFKSILGVPFPEKWNPFNWSKFVGRLLVAEDTTWFKSAQEARSRLAAIEKGRSEGLSGKRLAKFVDNELAMNRVQTADFEETAKAEYDNFEEGDYKGSKADYVRRRTRELQEKARDGDLTEVASDFARRATYNYQPEGILGGISRGVEMLSGTDKALTPEAKKAIGWRGTMAAKAVAMPMRLLIPFTRIVANVTNKAMDWTPVGLARAQLPFNVTYDSGFGKVVPKGTDQRSLELKKGIIGTAAMFWLMNRDPEDEDEFKIHGGGTGDFNKDRQLRAKGWMPYSIEYRDENGKSRFVSYKNTPLNIALGIIGDHHDDFRYHKDWKEKDFINKAAYTMSAAGSYIMDQSFISNVQDFMVAMNRKGENRHNSIMKMMSRMSSPSQAIPFSNLWNNLERDVFDKHMRDTDGYLASLIARTPVIRRAGKPMLDMLGDPIENRPLGWLFTKSGSGTKEAKIWNMIADKNAFITNPWYYHNKMDTDQYYDFVQIRGKYIKESLTDEKIQSILSLTDGEAKKEMQSLVKKATSKAKKDVNYSPPK